MIMTGILLLAIDVLPVVAGLALLWLVVRVIRNAWRGHGNNKTEKGEVLSWIDGSLAGCRTQVYRNCA